MWGQDFILPPAFWPAFLASALDAGQKAGGKPEGLTPPRRARAVRLSEDL
jgi:hypothetical protein